MIEAEAGLFRCELCRLPDDRDEDEVAVVREAVVLGAAR